MADIRWTDSIPYLDLDFSWYLNAGSCDIDMYARLLSDDLVEFREPFESWM